MVTEKEVIQEWKAFLESEEYCHDPECGTLLIAKHFADWQKERMMRGAIEVPFNLYSHKFLLGWQVEDKIRDILSECTEGDNVKIVVLREKKNEKL